MTYNLQVMEFTRKALFKVHRLQESFTHMSFECVFLDLHLLTTHHEYIGVRLISIISRSVYLISFDVSKSKETWILNFWVKLKGGDTCIMTKILIL